jgi:hypothetical protein
MNIYLNRVDYAEGETLGDNGVVLNTKSGKLTIIVPLFEIDKNGKLISYRERGIKKYKKNPEIKDYAKYVMRAMEEWVKDNDGKNIFSYVVRYKHRIGIVCHSEALFKVIGADLQKLKERTCLV